MLRFLDDRWTQDNPDCHGSENTVRVAKALAGALKNYSETTQILIGNRERLLRKSKYNIS